MTVVTWNPSDIGSNLALSLSDKKVTSTGAGFNGVRATLGRSTGKWYFEGVIDNITSTEGAFGLMRSTDTLTSRVGSSATGWGVLRASSSTMYSYHSNSGTEIRDGSWGTSGIVMQVAVDLDAGKIWFGANGTWFGSLWSNNGDPAAGTNPAYTGLSGTLYPAWASAVSYFSGSPNACTAHFIAEDLAYSPPTGYTAWDDTVTGNAGATLVGKSVVASTGLLTGNYYYVAISGKTVSVAKGLLTGNQYVAALTTKAVTTNKGLIGSRLSIVPATVAVEIQTGTITSNALANPTVELSGAAVSTQIGELGIQLDSNISFTLTGVSLSVTAQLVVPETIIGATGAQPITSTAVASEWTGYAGDYFPMGGISGAVWTLNNNFLGYNGKLLGVGEYAYGTTGQGSAHRRFGHQFDQEIRGKTWQHAPWAGTACDTPGDPTYFDPAWSGGGDHYVWGSDIAYDYIGPFGTRGGQFSLDLDGNMHFLHTRGYGYYANRTATPDIVYYYQVSDIYQEVFARYNFPVDAQHELVMGVYGHTANNAYVFYPAQNGSDWVPAYRRRNGAAFGAEVKLTSYTGNSSVNARQKLLCVVRSGYNDTIYVCYYSSTGHIGVIVMDAVTEAVTSHTLTAVVTPGTFFYEYNLFSSYVITTIRPERSLAEVVQLSNGTSVTQFMLKGQFVHLSWNSGTATAPTLTLKTGPSSAVGGWESLEYKGDEVYHVMYHRVDDSVYDPYSGSVTITEDIWAWRNDATGTGSSWTDSSSALCTFVEVFDANQYSDKPSLFFSGYGEGKQSVIYSVPCLFIGKMYDSPVAHVAWIDFWAGQQPYFTVSTKCRVGQVTISINLGPVAQLESKAVAIANGALGSTASVTRALSGVQLSVAQGPIYVGDAVYTPAGKEVAVQTGGLTTVITRAFAGVQTSVAKGVLRTEISSLLAGKSVSVSPGGLNTTLFCGLSGKTTAVQAGLFTPNLVLALAGKQVSVSSSTFATRISVGCTGVTLTAVKGQLTPVLSITLTGKILSVSAGQFSYIFELKLAGQTLTFAVGAFGVHSDVFTSVTGVQTIGRVGVYPTGTNVRKASANLLLWARTEVEKLFVPADDNDLETSSTDNKVYVIADEDDPLFNDSDEMQ